MSEPLTTVTSLPLPAILPPGIAPSLLKLVTANLLLEEVRIEQVNDRRVERPVLRVRPDRAAVRGQLDLPDAPSNSANLHQICRPVVTVPLPAQVHDSPPGEGAEAWQGALLVALGPQPAKRDGYRRVVDVEPTTTARSCRSRAGRDRWTL